MRSKRGWEHTVFDVARLWWVTANQHPEVPLDGPFERLEDCEARCLVRTDRWTTLRAMAGGRLPAMYVARQFETRIEVPHLYSSPNVAAETPTRAAVGAGAAAALPPVVYTYSRSALLVLCRALELGPPPGGLDRSGILEYMENQLRALARGAKGP